MRRLYPLSIPGNDFDSPGLHVIELNMLDDNLTARVTRTDSGCIKRHENADERNMCASEYVHGRMMTLRQNSNIAAAAVTYGNIAQAPAPVGLTYFTRGYTSGQISSGPSNDPNYASHEVGHVLGASRRRCAGGVLQAPHFFRCERPHAHKIRSDPPPHRILLEAGEPEAVTHRP